MEGWKHVVDQGVFATAVEQYNAATGNGITLISDTKIIIDHCRYYPWKSIAKRGLNPDKMVTESLRWGEPYINLDNRGEYVWCVPVTLNSLIVAGLFSSPRSQIPLEEQDHIVSEAAWKLVEIATDFNLCNSYQMKVNRDRNKSLAYEAEAIHMGKQKQLYNSRELFLQEESRLLSAIQNGDKGRARAIINKILIRIYALGKEKLDLLKTLVLELVVLMYRTAVANGADPVELMGVNCSYLHDFHVIEDDTQLCYWLTAWLESFIDVSLDHRSPKPPESIAMALEYIKNHLDEPVRREEVARSCNMSESHFSRVCHARTGLTFTELLQNFRIEHACFLFEETEKNIQEIALESGFTDQSYFSKVFKKRMGRTPSQYREGKTILKRVNMAK
jgi:AraC-like DNA-binding protein